MIETILCCVQIYLDSEFGHENTNCFQQIFVISQDSLGLRCSEVEKSYAVLKDEIEMSELLLSELYLEHVNMKSQVTNLQNKLGSKDW